MTGQAVGRLGWMKRGDDRRPGRILLRGDSRLAGSPVIQHDQFPQRLTRCRMRSHLGIFVEPSDVKLPVDTRSRTQRRPSRIKHGSRYRFRGSQRFTNCFTTIVKHARSASGTKVPLVNPSRYSEMLD